MANKIASVLGLDGEQTQSVPQFLVTDAFFNKLAEYGIQPQSEAEASKLWEIGERLQSQQAQAVATKQASVLDQAFAMVTKSAAAPEGQAAPSQQELAAEVQSKTAMYLNNPQLFAHGLARVGGDAE